MRVLGDYEDFSFKLHVEESTTYILCDVGSDMYMFMSPARQTLSAPTTISARSCWCCDSRTESGVFCLCGLFVGGSLVQKNPLYICFECIGDISTGWIQIKQNAISKSVTSQL